MYVYLSKSNRIAVKTEAYARVTNSTQMYSSEVQRGLQKFECKYLFIFRQKINIDNSLKLNSLQTKS